LELSIPVVILVLGSSCTGELSGASGAPSPDDGGQIPPPEEGLNEPANWVPGTKGDPNATAALPLRMITRSEYDQTISLILTDEYKVLPPGLDAASVLQSETIDESGFLSVGEISDVNVLRYMDAARRVASAVAPQLSSLMGCDVASAPDATACVRSFVESFGLLLYRRPLTPAELDQHVKFYQDEITTLQRTPNEAALQLLQAMLQSPYFLYRWEQGWRVLERSGNVARLNSYQVASRLSFFLWGSGPDRELLMLAGGGGLDTPEQVAARARKMLESPRAEASLGNFHGQWLGLSQLESLFKDSTRFPEWDADLRQAMQDEIKAFTNHVVLQGDGAVSSLLGASYSFVNEDLAALYGLSGIEGPELRRVELDPTQRGGLLTMPGLLAVASEASVANPFKRGKLVLEKLLCHKLEPPPVVPPLPTPDAADPTPERQVLEAMTGVSPCHGCHNLLNPLGFGLGNFDAIGRYRSKDDAGFDVDASGTLLDGTTFQNASGLSAVLANNDDVRACFTKHWFRFGFGREEIVADTHSLDTAHTAFAGTNYNIRELLVGFVTTRSFLYRTLEASEVVE
jgi:hypothetical protein